MKRSFLYYIFCTFFALGVVVGCGNKKLTPQEELLASLEPQLIAIEQASKFLKDSSKNNEEKKAIKENIAENIAGIMQRMQEVNIFSQEEMKIFNNTIQPFMLKILNGYEKFVNGNFVGLEKDAMSLLQEIDNVNKIYQLVVGLSRNFFEEDKEKLIKCINKVTPILTISKKLVQALFPPNFAKKEIEYVKKILLRIRNGANSEDFEKIKEEINDIMQYIIIKCRGKYL